ncbi:MAG: hypothetical protein ACRDO7_00470 [Nocardioidaceae bacterium]
MQKKTMIIGSSAAAGVLLLGGVAAVGATGGADADDGDDAPLTGSTLSRASEVAIDAAGGGMVTETESSGDHGGAYEVEVTLDNGKQVDVELDKAFNVVHTEADEETADSAENDGADD